MALIGFRKRGSAPPVIQIAGKNVTRTTMVYPGDTYIQNNYAQLRAFVNKGWLACSVPDIATIPAYADFMVLANAIVFANDDASTGGTLTLTTAQLTTTRLAKNFPQREGILNGTTLIYAKGNNWRKVEGDAVISTDPVGGLSVNFDFVARSYLLGEDLISKPLTTHASFQRNSEGLYWGAGVLTSAAANVPRLNDKGLLIERSRTNIVAAWNRPDQWNVTKLTGTPNGAVGLDGTLSAMISAKDSTISQQNVDVAVSPRGYCVSIYVKPLVANTGKIYIPGFGIYTHSQTVDDTTSYYDFSTGKFGAGMINGQWSVETDNGWTVIVCKQLNIGTQDHIYVLRIGNDVNSQFVFGGIQIEMGSTRTSMIHTQMYIEGATRAADNLFIPAGEWKGTSGGQLVVDADSGVKVDNTELGLVVTGNGYLRSIKYTPNVISTAIPLQIAAMNIAGADFGTVPGVYGTDYNWPTPANLLTYLPMGVKQVRLPFRWNRIQPTLKGALATGELARMKAMLDGAQANGMQIMLDMHDYFCRWDNNTGVTIGSNSTVTVAAWIDCWVKIATAFNGHPGLFAYGLMNEPQGTNGGWAAAAQLCINAIRAVDATTAISVAGDGYSTAENWISQNGPFFPLTGTNLIYEAHIYFDHDASGSYNPIDEVIDPNIGIYRAIPFFNWCKANGVRGIIGESGCPPINSLAMLALANLVDYCALNQVPLFYWAGGPFWPAGHQTACEVNGALLAQTITLFQHKKTIPRIGPVNESYDTQPNITIQGTVFTGV